MDTTLNQQDPYKSFFCDKAAGKYRASILVLDRLQSLYKDGVSKIELNQHSCCRRESELDEKRTAANRDYRSVFCLVGWYIYLLRRADAVHAA